MRPRRPVLAIIAMLPLAVVAAVVFSMLGALGEPDVPRVLPPPDAGPVEVGELEPGIVREAPWTPSSIIDGDPWALFDDLEGVAPWREHLPRSRYGRDPALGAYFVEEAVVLSDPAPCYHLTRIVRGVGVDLDEPAASRIAGQLMAWLDPAYFAGITPPDGLRDCQTRDRSQWGFAIEQVEPVACDLPDRDVRCFRAADWRHDFGERDTWWVDQLVFDAASGDEIADPELHPGLDVAALHVRLGEVLCDAEITCDPVQWRDGQLRPLAGSLVVALSPSDLHGLDQGVQLRIDRSVLPTRATGAGEPAA